MQILLPKGWQDGSLGTTGSAHKYAAFALGNAFLCEQLCSELTVIYFNSIFTYNTIIIYYNGCIVC